MYDIKTIEFGQQQQQQHHLQHHHKSATSTTIKSTNQPTTASTVSSHSSDRGRGSGSQNIQKLPTPTPLPLPPASLAALSSSSSSSSSVSLPSLTLSTLSSLSSVAHCHSPTEYTHMTLLSMRRRRLLQRHTCLLSILAAFVFGLVLGVFAPMFGLANVFAPTTTASDNVGGVANTLPTAERLLLGGGGGRGHLAAGALNRTRLALARPPSDFPTIYELHDAVSSAGAAASTAKQDQAVAADENPYAVAFIRERDVELPAQEALRDAFHVEQDRSAPDALLVQRLDAGDGSVREFRMQRIADGRFRKGPERRLANPAIPTSSLNHSRFGVPVDAAAPVAVGPGAENVDFVPLAQRIAQNARNQRNHGIIKANIYWGDLVERAMPTGFGGPDSSEWNRYVRDEGVVERLEAGCGRMQNRMVVFADGTRACARYRQNTDQIQGELFSFYLGQLLNLSNLAPSAASVVDVERPTWAGALGDITQAQWKQQRPVVLTRWLPDLEPAGIPQPFRPLERHLNKYDVWNITLASSIVRAAATDETPAPVLQRLIELAQWSDLIVFDYLIANLDRVVNNLYNYQWNADIMAAPAHNLARRPDNQLLVFLDNESGLLHGYRLLKKYEAYHGLLLDNLCVFRQSTIEALRQLRSHGVGQRLRELFERTTSPALRDVLPTLPDKSVKILVDRIDRVLGQVQKCADLLADS